MSEESLTLYTERRTDDYLLLRQSLIETENGDGTKVLLDISIDGRLLHIDVKQPDGSRVMETLSLQQLLIEWVDHIRAADQAVAEAAQYPSMPDLIEELQKAVLLRLGISPDAHLRMLEAETHGWVDSMFAGCGEALREGYLKFNEGTMGTGAGAGTALILTTAGRAALIEAAKEVEK